MISTKNKLHAPLPFVTLSIREQQDSLIARQGVTDKFGNYSLILNSNAQYNILATSVGFQNLTKVISPGHAGDTIVLTLVEDMATLGAVVVTGTRPLIRQEDDKTIIDPENLAISSTNAYEILEKTPGLFVDQDGNVYLNNTTPAMIYINGREQRMSTADIAAMLKSLPPGSIASIEILRTPSARYDASGGGGIVNVVLKKGVKIGLTGSVSAGFNQGVYGNQFAGFNINNSNGKLSSYANVQVSRRNNYELIRTDRFFAIDTALAQTATTRYPGSSYYLGYGIGYQFNSQWEINYDGRISLNQFDNNSDNLSTILKVSNNDALAGNIALVRNSGKNISLSQGIATKYKLDSIGSEWSNDLSYTANPGNTTQDFSTEFLRPGPGSTGGDGDIETRFHFLSAASNLLKKLPRKITLEAGIKTTFTKFSNATDYFTESGVNRKRDDFRTASYKYTENINAAFIQGSKNIDGLIIKVGTRLENTNMEGNQLVPRDTSFSIHRTDLFPYVYLSKDIMKIAGYELRAYLVYRRTISRPSYNLLNPFPRYIDPYLFETGNPSLRPQFTQNYEANISIEERPIFAVGINDTRDIFTNVIYQADSSRSLAYRTYDNLGSNKETYFRVLGAIPPGKRYFFVVGAQYNHNFYSGLYESKPLSFKRGSWSVFTYQTFRITPLTQFSLNGFARFNGQLQFYELSSFGNLNLSLNQQFLKKKLTISLSMNDVFFTNNNRFALRQGSVDASGYREADTRRFGMNVRYNFGLRKKEENNNMFNVESPDRQN